MTEINYKEEFQFWLDVILNIELTLKERQEDDEG